MQCTFFYRSQYNSVHRTQKSRFCPRIFPFPEALFEAKVEELGSFRCRSSDGLPRALGRIDRHVERVSSSKVSVNSRARKKFSFRSRVKAPLTLEGLKSHAPRSVAGSFERAECGTVKRLLNPLASSRNRNDYLHQFLTLGEEMTRVHFKP